MRYAPPFFEIDLFFAGAYLLAWAACLLLWRRQHACVKPAVVSISLVHPARARHSPCLSPFNNDK
jgi:predicted metal-binding membrane protein